MLFVFGVNRRKGYFGAEGHLVGVLSFSSLWMALHGIFL